MCWCTPGIRTPQCTKITCKPPVVAGTIQGWAPWHPTQGFEQPDFFADEGIAYLTLDDAARRVRGLNDIDGTTNRSGWRAVRVEVRKL